MEHRRTLFAASLSSYCSTCQQVFSFSSSTVTILYIAHRIPYPPNKGEKIRAFNQIKELSRNHAVHVCAFVDDRADLSHVPDLLKHCASVDIVFRDDALVIFRAAAAVFSQRPLSVSLFYRKEFAEKLLKKLLSKRFDCLICSSSSMAQYSHLVAGIPKVIDLIDVDSEKWRVYSEHRCFPLSLIYRLEGRRLAKYEETIVESFDHSILSSQEEQHLLQQRVPGCPVAVISNGVDFDYFRPSELGVADGYRPTIVFIGVMDYFPNVDAVLYFCREIFPSVCQSEPAARFIIVGRNPVRGVTKLANESTIVVTGTVADVRPYMAVASVSVAPFRIARGVQNKVLESMAMGVPVVGTSEAFKGIAATEMDGIRIADDPASFAGHVSAFLGREPTIRAQAGLQARAYVERHHQWRDRGAELETLLDKVVAAAARTSRTQRKLSARA